MVKQDKFATDLDYIESLPECPKSVLNDWDKLRKELEDYIEAPDSNGTIIYPLQDMYSFYMDTTDISPKFATTAVLFDLSSATRLEQRVITRQGDENLNLWFISIGQSSIMRKTTVERKNKKILRAADIYLIPSKFTVAGMFTALANNTQGALIRSEFSGLLSEVHKEHYQELPEALCEVYDCEPEIVRYTKTNKRESIDDSYITYWTSTQPINYELFTDRLFSQGFLMRYLYCMELEKWTWYDRSFDPKPEEETLETITGLLQAINSTYITTIIPSRKTVAYNAYQTYCKKVAMRSMYDDRSIIYSYYGRLEEFVLKIAGILELSRAAYLGGEIPDEDGELALTDETLDLAVKIVRLYEQEFRLLVKKVRAVAASDPVKTDRDNQQYVLDALTDSDGGIASIGELINSTKFGDKKVRAIIKTLETAGTIIGHYPERNAKGMRGTAPRLYWITRKDENFLEMGLMTDKWLETRDNK